MRYESESLDSVPHMCEANVDDLHVQTKQQSAEMSHANVALTIRAAVRHEKRSYKWEIVQVLLPVVYSLPNY
jgi:hypothetical protein